MPASQRRYEYEVVCCSVMPRRQWSAPCEHFAEEFPLDARHSALRRGGQHAVTIGLTCDDSSRAELRGMRNALLRALTSIAPRGYLLVPWYLQPNHGVLLFLMRLLAPVFGNVDVKAAPLLGGAVTEAPGAASRVRAFFSLVSAESCS